jgi:hypothetical protein
MPHPSALAGEKTIPASRGYPYTGITVLERSSMRVVPFGNPPAVGTFPYRPVWFDGAVVVVFFDRMRLLVSKVELAHILTERIQQLPEGRGFVITPFHIARCRVPRKHGGNWLPRHVMEDVTWLALLRVFSKAEEEFNLEEDPKAKVEDVGPIFVLHVKVKRAQREPLPANPPSSEGEDEGAD